MLVFGLKWVEICQFWRHYDVKCPNDVKLELKKCFQCVPRHSSLGLEGKITTKSGIKWVKVAQMLVFGLKWVEICQFWRHYDVKCPNDVKLELKKCFQCVPRHSSLGLEGKITTKSGIKWVKVAQMLVFGLKWVKIWKCWRHYDVTCQNVVKLELKKCF